MVIVLSLDTCDVRGSVALLRDGRLLASANHDSDEDYSSWLLPAVDGVLKNAGVRMAEVDGYGVAAGPGSFTGVRVSLTTVKAWSEVYGKPIAAVSRLEAIARSAGMGANKYVAAFADARRGHVFGGTYRRGGENLERFGEEMVIAPGRFVQAAAGHAGTEKIAWATTIPEGLPDSQEWHDRRNLGEEIEIVSSFLAVRIGQMAARQLASGHSIGSLELDANYLRRADTQFSWNDARGSGR